MGFRINTAIGWGMPFDRFVDLLELPDPGDPHSDGWYDHLDEVLAHTECMRGPIGYPFEITGKGQTVHDLMKFVGYDNITDVVLAPTANAARKWHRRDDDIDYALIWGPRGPRDHEVPENRVEYLSIGFHPYGDLRMDTRGNDVPKPASDDYEAVYRWEEDKSLLPGVPEVMRHWLAKSELLGPKGVAQLRPVRAVWWA